MLVCMDVYVYMHVYIYVWWDFRVYNFKNGNG